MIPIKRISCGWELRSGFVVSDHSQGSTKIREPPLYKPSSIVHARDNEFRLLTKLSL